MKRLLFFLVCGFFVFPATAQLTQAERSSATEYLRNTKSALQKSVEGLSPAQLSYKSAPDRWSVAECVEHVALVEFGIFQILQNALKTPADPAKPRLAQLPDAELLQHMTDRSKKAKTPEPGAPTGKFPSVDASLRAFGDRRDQTIAYVQSTPDDLRKHQWTHPMFGPMDLYQMVLLIGGHGERHRLQIEEVKSGVGFPQ